MKMFSALAAPLFVFAAALDAQIVTPDWCKVEPRPAYSHLQRVPSADPWFEVYRVTPNTYAIYEPHQWQETVMYLILGRQRAVLLDTGMGIGDLRRVVTALTSLPITVVNTHTHTDHVGDNWQFHSIADMDTPYTREHAHAQPPEYANEVKDEIAPEALCGKLPAEFHPDAYVVHPWKITRFLHDGDVIDLGGRKLQVIAVPGHTPDSLALFDRENGLLFTGDTFYPHGRIFLIGPGTDTAAYAVSVRRLAALTPQVKLVLGGHNEPVAPPSVLPRLAQAFALVQSGKVAAVPAGPGMVVYTADGIPFLMAAPALPTRTSRAGS